MIATARCFDSYSLAGSGFRARSRILYRVSRRLEFNFTEGARLKRRFRWLRCEIRGFYNVEVHDSGSHDLQLL